MTSRSDFPPKAGFSELYSGVGVAAQDGGGVGAGLWTEASQSRWPLKLSKPQIASLKIRRLAARTRCNGGVVGALHALLLSSTENVDADQELEKEHTPKRGKGKVTSPPQTLNALQPQVRLVNPVFLLNGTCWKPWEPGGRAGSPSHALTGEPGPGTWHPGASFPIGEVGALPARKGHAVGTAGSGR